MKTSVRRVVLGLSLLAFLGAVARGQEPSGPAATKIFTKRKAFKLPLQIQDRDRAQLQEVKLFVKEGPNGQWAFAQAAVPTQKEFIYRVSDDGEYSFIVVIVDKKGKQTPADIAQEPPALVVVVDTQAPEIELHPEASTVGDSAVQCVIRDANLDFSKVKVECQADGASWQTLDAIPSRPGYYRLPLAATAQGTVRATAVDRAGNTTTREVRLVPAQAQVANETSKPSTTEAARTGAVEPSKFVYTEPAAPSATEKHVEKVPATNVPYTVPATAGAHPEKLPGAGATAEVRTEKFASGPAPVPLRAQVQEAVIIPTPKPAPPPRQLVNGTHVSLKYQIDPAAPKGTDRVSVWMTRDDGQNWQHLCDDADRRSPVEIDLPGEGIFGLSLVIGGAGEAPAPGETPGFIVEVDTTKPSARLQTVHDADSDGTYLITWTASDRNLKPEPIDLFYATCREGPWRLVARGLQNTGRYHWQPPENEGSEFFIRMDVSDLAGNTVRCDSLQPIVLDESHTNKIRRVGFTSHPDESVAPSGK